MKKIILILAALFTAMTTWASTFTVDNDGNNFIITRNGSGVETIYYRTVNLSALAGENYTERTGKLIFSEDEVEKTIPINEVDIDSYVDYNNNIYNLQYAVQTGLVRSYRFELLSGDGDVLAYKDRDLEFGKYYQLPTAYVNKSITDLVYFDDAGDLKSGIGNKYLDLGTVQNTGLNWTKVTDAGYSQSYHLLKTDVFNGSPYVRIYANNIGMKVYATVFFKQKEENDGYQYIQILDNNYVSFDGNDPDGAVNAPEISQYKACFELSKSGVTTDEHYQFFPHRYDFVNKAAEQNAGLTHYSFDYNNSYLYEQKYVNNSVHPGSSGSLIFSPTNYYICVRFDAAGNGDDNWYFKELKARVALVDATAPTVINNKYSVSGGRHSRGNTFYVSVAFNEIVTVSGTPTLNSTWGSLSYVAGSGSNVLTFSGTIGATATGALTVNSYGGTITDLAGNALSGTINHSFSTSVDARSYSISYNLAGGSMPSGQSNPTSYTDLSASITLINPVRAGYTFLGWTGSNGNTPQTTVTIPSGSTGNLSYTANWSAPINYSITYNLDGGTLPSGQVNPTTYNAQTATFTLNNPIKEDYIFLGWTGSNGDTPQTTVTVAQGSTGDRNYTANWMLRPPRYSFDSETGVLTLNWGEFNKDDKWGDDVPASAVTSVTATDEVSFTGDCSELFQGFSNCTSFDLNSVNTSNATSMRSLFTGCANLTSLDISSWDTGNVTDMWGMFLQCNRLNSLDLTSFNTSNVTNMAFMFDHCTNLKTLKVSGWDTGNVTMMSNMFCSCPSLKKLDLMDWETDNVTMMNCMFTACESLTTILVSPDWNTANVTNSSVMFAQCPSLVGGMGTTYDENHLDKEYARIDGGPECPGYFTLKLPRYTYDSETGVLSLNWGEFNRYNKWGDDVVVEEVKSVIATDEVSFTGDCTELFFRFFECTNFDLNNVNTENVTNMSEMFVNCGAETIDLSRWNTSNVTNMYQLFAYSDFVTLNIKNWDTSNVTNMEGMFAGSSHITSLNLSGWNISKVTNMHEMFYYCTSLTSLNTSGWDTGNVTNMKHMFYHCESIKTLNLSNWDTGKVINMNSMFCCCFNLVSLNLSGWNTSKVDDMQYMFEYSSNLTTIYAGASWSTTNVFYGQSMFHNCNSLVGGMGTTYNPSWTNKDFARIDGGPSDPGYFTEGIPVVEVPGDVNGDGSVTSADVTCVYNYLLNGDDTFIDTCDVNGDGYITSADITVIYNILLGSSK
jgi:uncharacterized repeat protein (TIGR02543 family)